MSIWHFLVWFDFGVFGWVHNPLQVFVKVTEQDKVLTLEKKYHVIILSPHSSYSIKAKKIAAMTNFQFVNANQLRANIVNRLAWYNIAVRSRLYEVLQHAPSNLSGKQWKNFDFYCETVPCNVNLLVDQRYANYFQSCKCSGSITEKWRWWKQVKRLRKIRLTNFASIFSNMSDWAKQHLQNGPELFWQIWK